MKFLAKKTILYSVVVLTLPLYANAQFGNLIQQLKKNQPSELSGSQVANTSSARGKSNVGLVPSGQWCREQSGSLGKMKVEIGVIGSEFTVPDPEALQDLFQKAFRKDKINKTFPNARFFQASFETKKVRAIFDTFMAFPEPETLAALIQISRGLDQQESSDALMALTFLHLQAPELSINKDRWWTLYQSALGSEHFTALVFKARLNTYGEYAARNLNQALGDLVSAGNLKSRYGQSEGGPKKEFDIQNYQLIHTSTVKDIFQIAPNLPAREAWKGPAQMAGQIEQAQAAYAQQLPNTRIGRIYSAAGKLNAEALEIGNNIIKKTQDGNKLTGQLEGLKSLRNNLQGEKPIFEDISPEIQAAQIKMIATAGTLDEEQKRMLTLAQEKRLAAQGIIAQSYAELFQILISNMSGDMVKMAAPLPALTQANNALIQSCLITAKWEQAMRAKDVPKVDAKRAESTVADLSSQFKD